MPTASRPEHTYGTLADLMVAYGAADIDGFDNAMARGGMFAEEPNEGDDAEVVIGENCHDCGNATYIVRLHFPLSIRELDDVFTFIGEQMEEHRAEGHDEDDDQTAPIIIDGESEYDEAEATEQDRHDAMTFNDMDHRS